MPKISVIVPVYNVGKYLPACLDSLVGQTLQEIEIITINDCSADNSLEILEEYSKKDKRIILVNNKRNKKTAYVRNQGISLAKGEYLSFIDGDDYLCPDFFERLYKKAKKENSDITKGLTRVINKDGTVTTADDNIQIRKSGKFYFMGHLLTAIYHKKNLIDKFNIRFYIDFFCFQVQAVYYANKIACEDKAFYNYIRHEGSCDSDSFTLEKWQRLNIGHANFIYNWINGHKYPGYIKNLYLSKIKELYFYGYNKLPEKDILEGSKILADIISTQYNCGYEIKDIKKLRRVLFRENGKAKAFDYYFNIIRGKL